MSDRNMSKIPPLFSAFLPANAKFRNVVSTAARRLVQSLSQSVDLLRNSIMSALVVQINQSQLILSNLSGKNIFDSI